MIRAAATLLLLLVTACGGPATPAESPTSSAWLDGRERSFLVVGYSTSFAWPTMLQAMLDQHAGGERRYHVLNAVVGGCPVGMWIAPEGRRDHGRTIEPMARDFLGPDAGLRGDAPEPTVALCQQSLQYSVEGMPRGPVTSAHDMAGAELGADLLQEMCTRLRDLGLEDVLIAMHVYKEPVGGAGSNATSALAVTFTP